MSEQRPKNLVVVLLDSLNRHLLEAYGGDEFATPHRALRPRALRFTGHHVGSLPCMPARHDILVGALDFPWRPWGSIEGWERHHPVASRRGVTTMLVSDHPHLFETGGENYHTDFSAWAYERATRATRGGHARPDLDRAPTLPVARQGDHHRLRRLPHLVPGRGGLPGPETMAAAAGWIRQAAASHDRFFLMVDEFDPHEPFDTPRPYASIYDPDWEGPLTIWPPYLIDAVASGRARRRTGPPHPGQLRREADDDRPLVRAAARRHRPGRAGRGRPPWSSAPTTATT